MSNKPRATTEAVATADGGPINAVSVTPATSPPSQDPFEGVSLKAPLLQLARNLLAPYLAHRANCDGLGVNGCTCGLREAVLELERRENIVQRYGSAE